MKQALQVFSLRAAASEAERQSPYRNFLIIAPEPADTQKAATPDARVTALAHHLNHDGYAYVARSNQKEMQDDEAGVRYLPLHEKLPEFGVMTAVIAIGDPAWAARAAAAYPAADIFLLKLS
jgi:hypothetical protein